MTASFCFNMVVSRPQHAVRICGLPTDSDRPQRPKKCEIDVNCAEVRAGSSR
ncbi:hypothetical protein K525DRAFT_275664 [Schizophyllum commune Loenen D]|nr:hypothetical protein K525DRAFT_275664 [Schizophyllum commune Loenen D]